jgi:hypothetical protein
MIGDLTPEQLEAVRSYAAQHGRKWKEALCLDWYNARAIGERGSILHGLRNSPLHGHRWLAGFKLPKT